MLSKCLNSRCSATFQYLGQGRLYRVDFADAGKKSAGAGKGTVACIRSQTHPIEHFWLCDACAATMTVALSDAGEVRLVPAMASGPKPIVSAAKGRVSREANAS